MMNGRRYRWVYFYCTWFVFTNFLRFSSGSRWNVQTSIYSTGIDLIVFSPEHIHILCGKLKIEIVSRHEPTTYCTLVIVIVAILCPAQNFWILSIGQITLIEVIESTDSVPFFFLFCFVLFLGRRANWSEIPAQPLTSMWFNRLFESTIKASN